MTCCEKMLSRELAGKRRERRPASRPISRRAALTGMAGAAALAGAPAFAQAKKIRLAFCGQLLCVVPYEVTRDRGHFREEGLEVELVYTRGGNQAMQALVGGAVDYAGTSFDVVLAAYAAGAKIRRFASTGRLPLFALATAPKTAAEIRGLKDLEGRTVGISGLGNADQTILLYLLKKAGADANKVKFAAIGTNLYDALRLGQVEAAMVQEPALTLINELGGRTLMNAMNLADAHSHLGGQYEFMGVAVRAEEFEQRRDEMRRLARALAKGLLDARSIAIEEVVAAVPKELIAGGDRARIVAILERYRKDLYPDNVAIDRKACDRVLDAHKVAGLVKPELEIGDLLDFSIVAN